MLERRMLFFIEHAWKPLLVALVIGFLAWKASADSPNPVIANRLCRQLWTEWGGGGGEAKYVAACQHSFMTYGDGREVGNCFISNGYGEAIGEGPCSPHQERGEGGSR